MAINYTKIGWDTSTYVKPSNMNQMDDGIKAACDGVDALNTAIAGYVKLSNAGRQTIVNTSSDLITAFKSNSTSKGLISFLGSDNTTFGHIGVNSSKKPIFNSGTAEDEIALKKDVIATHKKTFTAVNDTFLLPTGWKRVECRGVISNYRVCVSVGYNDGLTCAGFAAGYHDGTRSFSIAKSSADVLTLQALINLDSVLVYVSF